MAVTVGSIVNNLSPNEPVTITEILPLGDSVSVTFTGVHTKRSSDKIIPQADFDALEPVSTKGEFDFSGNPERFSLFAEAERISSAYQFDKLFAVNCSVIDPLPHQVEAVYKYLLPLPQIRFLLADDTGAGKTIMTGLLLKELLLRNLIERILIVTPGGLTKQWQEDEMAEKFAIDFKLVNRAAFTADPMIFHSSNRIITSIDFISRDDIRNTLQSTRWDIVIFDEAHKLSAYDYGMKQYISKRYEAAKTISLITEHLLLLTATPHRGRTDTFKLLLQLLDEDIFATHDLAADRVKEIEKNGANRFFIRRLKEEMKDWNNAPLYKNRFTRTVTYELTPEEKNLYDCVTKYLTAKKKQASAEKNIHVSLALTVMQRRLVSSIYAIYNTLKRRYESLNAILAEIDKHPDILKAQQKVSEIDPDTLDEFDELSDTEREEFENGISDYKKFKLFTTGKSRTEIQNEVNELRDLFELSKSLYISSQEEKKFLKLQELLREHGVLEKNEKLVIFTEHRDTLQYLEDRLKKNFGYEVATIHGGKNIDERIRAQRDFAKPDTQILICTDAAGEGINLQFARLLINWDIPWNPNRLEQRMGRIHRYGQKKDVLVFNLVAGNTKEGQVLERLLTKLDLIRAGIGDDRVYDVIQDVLEDVDLNDIIKSVFDGESTKFNEILDLPDDQLAERFKEKLVENKGRLSNSSVDYPHAKQLKDLSDERRLQPIYVRRFFEKAFDLLGGRYQEVREKVFQIIETPPAVKQILLQNYHSSFPSFNDILFCFDKQVFLDFNQNADPGQKVFFISPGVIIFDALVAAVRNSFREDMLRGTILVSPVDTAPHFAFFVKSQITDNRPHKLGDSVADERLLIVSGNNNADQSSDFSITSPAKFIDLSSPVSFAKEIQPPPVMKNSAVVQWCYQNITTAQLNEVRAEIEHDAQMRMDYLNTAFTHIITDLQSKIVEEQGKIILGDFKAEERVAKLNQTLRLLIQRRKDRIDFLSQMRNLNARKPEVIGCAFVMPLTQVEYKSHFGMHRDDEAEASAMQFVMDYERQAGRTPEDVSKQNLGYDIRSTDANLLHRYIEVKGRSGPDGSVMLSENELNRLIQLGDTAFLYIVVTCKTTPKLSVIQNPGACLKFELISKGVQYFLPMKEWEGKTVD